MNVTRDEAAQALDDISKASDRVVRLKGYHHGAPHFIVWGVVWLFANTITQFWPEYARYAWPAGILTGAVTSIAIAFFQTRHVKPGAASSIDKRTGQRIGMTSGIMFLFIFCLINIAQPDSNRETNAMISILFPFLYMCAGIWAGWRLFAIGLVTAVAIMFGFFYVKDWFDLWMGIFAGGSLIAGGIWLRTA
jgi:hypothetical protein